MKMEIEESKEDVKSLVLETLKKNDCSKQECNIMITFLGGKTGDSSGLIAAHPSRLLIFITPSRKHPEEFYINGISVGLIEHARSNADIKSPMTYGPALLAQNTLAKDGAYNEILYTDKGRVLEGTTFSFFIIKDDESVVTSKADGSILSSITRLVLIDILKNNQINVEERDLTLDELYQSKEAFIASSTRDVIPVVSIENNAIGDGKIGNTTKKIIDQLSVLKGLNPKNLMIAYEPIWAIGTGNNASSEYIRDVHSVIKNELENLLSSNTDIPIAYGGSIDTSNVETIVKTLSLIHI